MEQEVKIPKVGDRVRMKSVNIKGTIVYIDEPSLFLHYVSPIQVELDEPYDEHEQTMLRTNLRDIKLLKPAKAKKKEESLVFGAGDTVMIMIKKKTGYEPTSAKILSITRTEVKAKCSHEGVVKTKTIPIDKFFMQRHRYVDMMKNADTKKKSKKQKERSFNDEIFSF